MAEHRATFRKSVDARWLALLVATAIIFYLCWLMLQPFADVLMWSIVLAMLSYPLFKWFVKKGKSEAVSAGLTTAAVVLVLLVPMAFVINSVAHQAKVAGETMHLSLAEVLSQDSKLYKLIDPYFDLDGLRDPKVLKEKFTAMIGGVMNRTWGLLGGILGVIVQAFFVLFTLYYLLRDAKRIVPAVRNMVPLTSEQTDVLFKRTGEVISASVNGVLVISAIQGFLGIIGFWALGLSGAVLWGVVMFLMSTIPMAGAFVVWGPAAVYLLATGHWIKALLLTIWGAGVIGLIDNVLRPHLVGKKARLHELIIFFSVLGGLQVFGVLGLFVGPVVAAIALALVDIFKEARGEAPTGGVTKAEVPVAEAGPELKLEGN